MISDWGEGRFAGGLRVLLPTENSSPQIPPLQKVPKIHRFFAVVAGMKIRVALQAL
jgi:hypothetical protein